MLTGPLGGGGEGEVKEKEEEEEEAVVTFVRWPP
jgi:hypothetical protein